MTIASWEGTLGRTLDERSRHLLVFPEKRWNMSRGMTDAEFEEVIQEALDGMPDEFLEALDNIAIVMADEPSDDQLEGLEEDGSLGGAMYEDELLGLFDGLSLVERADGFEDDIPDVITIFKGPHERCFPDRADMVNEIRKTVIHEIGHYFGLDDERLHAIGY